MLDMGMVEQAWIRKSFDWPSMISKFLITYNFIYMRYPKGDHIKTCFRKKMCFTSSIPAELAGGLLQEDQAIGQWDSNTCRKWQQRDLDGYTNAVVRYRIQFQTQMVAVFFNFQMCFYEQFDQYIPQCYSHQQARGYIAIGLG